jgi:hypothetical protein
MQCWVCKRQARGYGHADHRYGIDDPRRYPLDWVFCSRRCQDVFHTLYGKWRGSVAATHTEVGMIDPSDVELQAMRQCLKPFGEAAGEIGFDKPLGAYSEAEAMRVIDAIVTEYTEAMLAHHTATSHACVRVPPLHSGSVAQLPEDLPWLIEPGAAP